MKQTTKYFFMAIAALTGLTLAGFLIGAGVVYYLLTIRAKAWAINNSMFFFTLGGLVAGLVFFIRILITNWMDAYRKEVLAKESKA